MTIDQNVMLRVLVTSILGTSSSYSLTLTAVWVVGSQVEEAVLAAVTALTLHVLFADTLTAEGIAHAAVSGSGGVAVTR